METSSYGNISDSKDIIIRDLSPISPVIYTVLETANAIVPECMEIIKTRCTNLDLIPKTVNSYFYPSFTGPSSFPRVKNNRRLLRQPVLASETTVSAIIPYLISGIDKGDRTLKYEAGGTSAHPVIRLTRIANTI